MAIHAQQALSQIVASDPQPTFTSKNNPRFHASIGQEHHGREPKGRTIGPRRPFYAGPVDGDERRG
ncbi:MAG: hypothetical protein HOQ07_06995 [Sinomonas sp.]|nr:hypothetical protein [Sinomonas sp.]